MVPALSLPGPRPEFQAKWHPEPESRNRSGSATNIKHSEAVEAYNAHFPQRQLASFEELQVVMSIDPQVRTWYKSHRTQRAAEMQVPQHLKQAGITAEEWASTEELRQARRRIRAWVADKSASLTQRYKAELQDIRVQGQKLLREHEIPLVLAMEANVAQLEPEAKVRLATQRADAKWNAVELDRQLASARAEWVRQARKGTLHFDPDAYPVMPL